MLQRVLLVFKNNILDREHGLLLSRRLQQVIWAILLALIFSAYQEWGFDNIGTAVELIVSAVAIVPALFMARQQRLAISCFYLLTVLFLSISLLAWRNFGPFDVALFAYPGILVIAILLSQRLTFFVLSSAMLLFLSVMILVHALGIQQWQPDKNIYSHTLVMLIIFLGTMVCMWVLEQDVSTLLLKANKRHTQYQHSQQQLNRLAYFDSLTGLPNRILAEDRFKQSWALASRNEQIVGFLYVDLDHFKAVTDNYGHNTGDQMLVAMGHRLLQSVRQSDTVSHIGGDEFLLIVSEIKSASDLQIIAQQVLKNISQPMVFEEQELVFTASVGISYAPVDGSDFDDLLKKSDVAMFRSKEQGRNCFNYYDKQLSANLLQDIALATELRQCIELNQLELHFQPKIRLVDNKVMGAEALIRWRHPKKGLIPPDYFIPVAESSGLILELGEWVLHEACIQCHRWHQLGFEDLTVAVNISSKQMSQRGIEKDIMAVLEQTKLDGRFLELELTESYLTDKTDSICNRIEHLKQAGMKISIDDFGTGYSNLAYLKNFDIDNLKIDREFVSQMNENEQDSAIVSAVIQISKSLGLVTIAEGVETENVKTKLMQMGCQYAQGYFWSKPVTGQAFIEFLRQH